MKQKDLFSIHTNQLITLLICYNSHILQSKNEKEEQTALDEISQAIKSYNTKMTKAQLKWQHLNLICTARIPNVWTTTVEESVKKKKKRIAVTPVVGAEKRPTNLIVKTEMALCHFDEKKQGTFASRSTWAALMWKKTETP